MTLIKHFHIAPSLRQDVAIPLLPICSYLAHRGQISLRLSQFNLTSNWSLMSKCMTAITDSLTLRQNKFVFILWSGFLLLIIPWRYSPTWSLASSNLRIQTSLSFAAHLLQFLKFQRLLSLPVHCI
jgi:hypothetical protein